MGWLRRGFGVGCGLVMVLAVACDGGTEPGSTTEPEVIVRHREPPPDHLGNIQRALERVRDGGRTVVDAVVAAIAEETLTFEAVGVIAAAGEIPETYTVAAAWLDAEVRDEAVLMVTSDGDVWTAAVWDPATAEPRLPVVPFALISFLGRDDMLSRLWVAPGPVCGFGFAETYKYDDPAEVIIAFIDGATPRQAWDVRQGRPLESVARAERIAGRQPDFEDAVTGLQVPTDELYIYRQFIAKIPRANIEFQPTVPVLFDTSQLTDEVHFALVDRESGWLLTYDRTDSGVVSPGLDVLRSYGGQPEIGHDVSVIVSDDLQLLTACFISEEIYQRFIEDGTVIAEVPYNDYAGERRLLVNLATGDFSALYADAFTRLDAGYAPTRT